MADIKIALSTVQFNNLNLEHLRSELYPAELITVNRLNAPSISAALRNADVAIIHGDIDERFLHAPKLRWVHCNHSGIEKSALPDVFEKGLLITSSAGRSAPAIAEHALFFMLALSYQFPRFIQAQRTKQWGIFGQDKLKALYGATVGIVGLGHTGSELAKRAKAFGMHVICYRRKDLPTPPEVDQIFSTERGETLDELLNHSDFVVLALSLSNSSYHLIGERELSIMKESAYLINVSRGSVIDETALLHALMGRRIAGAGLDVAEDEPLPASSLLWTAPNTLITPHFTPGLPDQEERSLDIICENIKRFRTGKPMLNQLTPNDLYSVYRSPRKNKGGPRNTGMLARAGLFVRRLRHWMRTR